MNVQAAIKELQKTMPKSKPRAAFGTWPTYAWLVRGLVEKGHGISDAVNHVLTHSGVPNTKQSFGSLRAAFYKIRLDEWPAAMAPKTEPEPEGSEFE